MSFPLFWCLELFEQRSDCINVKLRFAANNKQEMVKTASRNRTQRFTWFRINLILTSKAGTISLAVLSFNQWPRYYTLNPQSLTINKKNIEAHNRAKPKTSQPLKSLSNPRQRFTVSDSKKLIPKVIIESDHDITYLYPRY